MTGSTQSMISSINPVIGMMGSLFLCNTTTLLPPFPKNVISYTCPVLPPNLPYPRTTSSSVKVNCKKYEREDDTLSSYEVLGVNKNCSITDLKTAFRARVKQFHPDVQKDASNSDVMIRQVIRAYEMLSKIHQFETFDTESLDPFDEPECEATDLFVNQTICIGKGCAYSCVERASHVFSFTSNGTARATWSKGHGDEYQVQLAVGQCPRNCIHYVTPSQRIVLEELLDSILSMPYNDPAEVDYLYSLIRKAKFENNRYKKPRREPIVTIYNVDCF